MKIALGADHAGYQAKEKIKQMLEKSGTQVLDLGTQNTDSCDYPDYAKKVALAVAQKEADKGILVCGTGIGMSMAANKIAGVRAALCFDEEMVQLSREHNDSNVLCLGARKQVLEKLTKLVEIWLQTPFTGGRHQRRVDKIENT